MKRILIFIVLVLTCFLYSCEVIDSIDVLSVNLTSSDGIVDTYTITFNNGTNTTFAIPNTKSIASLTYLEETEDKYFYSVLFSDNTTQKLTIDKLKKDCNHSYNTYIEKYPTSLDDGVAVSVCSNCDDVIRSVIPSLGHSYNDEVMNPTYYEEGYTIHTCTRCGYEYKSDYTEKLEFKKGKELLIDNEVEINSLLPSNIPNASWCYKNLDLFSASLITSISIPIMELKEDVAAFTIYVAKKNDILNKITLNKNTNIKKYEFTLYKNELTLPCYKTFENLSILVSDDETIVFGETTDTIRFGYLPSIDNVSYSGFYGSVFHGGLRDIVSNSLCFKISGYYFDDLTLEEKKLAEILNGKTFSILGDSISTYDTVSNNPNANTTIEGNYPRYGNESTTLGTIKTISYNETYYGLLEKRLGLKLLVNNSLAGGRMEKDQASGGVVTNTRGYVRCLNLDNDLTGVNPDYIFVMLGTNDLTKYNSSSIVNFKDVDLDKLIIYDEGIYTYLEPINFTEAYIIAVHKMLQKYETSKIFLINILPRTGSYKVNENLYELYNDVILDISIYFGLNYIDVFNSTNINLTNAGDYLVDGIHPDVSGFKEIYNAIINSLIDYNFSNEITNLDNEYLIDANKVQRLNQILSKQDSFNTKDDYGKYFDYLNVNLNCENTNCLILIDQDNQQVVLYDKVKNKQIYPINNNEVNYSNYEYIKTYKSFDITPSTFTKNTAYRVQNLAVSYLQSSLYFETSQVDISSYNGYTISFLLPVYRTLDYGQCPYGVFTANSGLTMEKKWLVINPGTQDRYYIKTCFVVDDNDKILYLSKLMDGIEYYTYIGDYQITASYQECINYYFIDQPLSNNYITLNSDELSDYYSISSTGTLVDDLNYSSTNYIDCKNAIGIKVKMIKGPTIKYLCFYDDNKNLISSIQSLSDTSYSSEYVNIDVPDNSSYFRASYYDYNQSLLYGEFDCFIYYDDSYQINEYRSYIDEPIYFSQKINQNINYYTDSNYQDKISDYLQTTGVLLLPSTYKNTGEKTKLIIYVHGYSHYVYNGKWGSTDNFYQQKEYYTSMGFAVMDCNGARDDSKNQYFTSCGAPQFTQAYYECYQYIINHYNIDPKVYLIGGSAGGLTAINFAYQYSDIVRCLILISTWISGKDFAWGQGVRSNYVEYFNFNNTSTYENDKVGLFDPSNHIIDNKISDLKIPIRIVYGETEKDTSFIVYLRTTYYNALVNGNANVEIEEIKGYGHEIVSGNITLSDSKNIEFMNKY